MLRVPGRPKKVADPESGSLFEWREDGGGHKSFLISGERGNCGLSCPRFSFPFARGLAYVQANRSGFPFLSFLYCGV